MRDRVLRKLLPRLYALVFFRNLAFVSAVLVPFFTDWGGLTLVQVQLVQSWFMLCLFLLEIPTGIIADRWGRRTSLIVSSLLAIPGMLLYGLIPDLKNFLVCEFLLAASAACSSGAREAWIFGILASCKRTDLAATVFGRAQVANLVALSLAAPIGSWIASRWGLNAPMFAWALPQFAALLCALSLPERNFIKKQKQSYRKILVSAWNFAQAAPSFRCLTYNLALISIGGYFVIWLYQPLLRADATPIAEFGWYHSFLVLIQIAILQWYPTLLRLSGSRYQYLKLTALCVALGYGLTAICQSSLKVIFFLTLAGGFGLTRGKIGDAYLAELAPESERASLLSGASMFNRLCLVIANPLVGWLSDYSIDYSLALLGLISFMAVLLPAYKIEPR